MFALLLLAFSFICTSWNADPTWSTDFVIESILGDSADLPCELNGTEDAVALILWYRGEGGGGRPIYSVDAREKTLRDATHFPGPNLGSRALYDPENSVLRIFPVQTGDQGLYRCLVEYRRARTDTQESFLHVITPPHDAIIMDEYGQRLHGVIGPYNEGSSLTLICEGDGGSPPPAVTWWRDGELIDDSYRMTPQDFSRNELIIPALNRSDLMAVLTCQASNSNLTAPVTSSVTLDLNLRPLEVHITTLYRPLSAGHPAELVCTAKGARPPAQVTWWQDGTRRLGRVSENALREDNLTISVLTLTPTPQDHGRNLTCRADSPHVRDSEIEDTWTLDVYYVPRVSVRLDAVNQGKPLREGTDAVLTCDIRANPQPQHVSWLFNGTSLFIAPHSGLVISGNTLILRGVRKEHRGTYQCAAQNSEGRAESNKLHLKVHYAPQCNTILSQSRYGVSPNDPIELTCEVDADPSEGVSFRWALNATGSKLRAEDPLPANGSSSLRSKATLLPQESPGPGEVLCWGENSIGPQREPCVFRLFPTGPPSPPRNCLMTNQSADTLVIQCEPGDDGGLTQSFRAEVLSHDQPTRVLRSNVTARDAPVFILCNLMPDSAFLVIIHAINAKGESTAVAVQARTLPLPESARKDYELLSYFLGIIIGAIAVLVVTMIGVFVGTKYKQKKKRKGKLLQKEEEKAQAHLIKECTKGPRIQDSQGPDIIPDKSYFQAAEKGEQLIQGRADSNGFEKYQDVPLQYVYSKSRGTFKDDPTMAESPRKHGQTDLDDAGITVETPLINDLQQKAPARLDRAPFTEPAILSTSV